ncbi:MAG: U32 family peptidase [Tissierellia bacterium]|nr:U32 family peptidase [Tissierellia bacterium]
MKKMELLAPAGDLTKLKTAIAYGADAVYLAGDQFGLRKASKNFSLEELEEAVEIVHHAGKKLYITLNIIPHNKDLDGLEDYVRGLVQIGVDALIVSDAGMVAAIRRVTKDLEIHLSTQASTTNYETVNFWYDYGIRRVILARELSLEELKEIRSHIPDDMQLEIFGHGAMCISYSGRCLLSNYMTGRDANLGDCAHACRWKYSLVEEKRPGEYLPVIEDEEGAYILNSRDLCLLQHIGELAEAGIDSLKIEGRVKSQYYVATVLRSYRVALDAYYDGSFNAELATELIDEIRKASHRDFTTGFLYGKPNEEGQVYGSASYIRGYDFVGLVLDYDEETGISTVEQRNRFGNGDVVEVFGPERGYREVQILDMRNEKDEPIEIAPHAQQILRLKIGPTKPWYMLRKVIKG